MKVQIFFANDSCPHRGSSPKSLLSTPLPWTPLPPTPLQPPLSPPLGSPLPPPALAAAALKSDRQRPWLPRLGLALALATTGLLSGPLEPIQAQQISGPSPADLNPPVNDAQSQETGKPGHGNVRGRELVLDRRRRLLLVIDSGQELRRFSVAVGRPGWETPVGQFEVIERVINPVWKHPATGQLVPAGPENPLGSRWIGFHRDCGGRRGFNGRSGLTVKGCATMGFHGTPNRRSVGQAVSHGCVRLYDEQVRELFELVSMGTPVIVLP
jgi:L,D-transpeptidase ErfK/SrfK